MTLDQAIATHPELWDRMGLMLRTHNTRVDGLVEALALVGKFAEADVWERLLKDFG